MARLQRAIDPKTKRFLIYGTTTLRNHRTSRLLRALKLLGADTGSMCRIVSRKAMAFSSPHGARRSRRLYAAISVRLRYPRSRPTAWHALAGLDVIVKTITFPMIRRRPLLLQCSIRISVVATIQIRILRAWSSLQIGSRALS